MLSQYLLLVDFQAIDQWGLAKIIDKGWIHLSNLSDPRAEVVILRDQNVMLAVVVRFIQQLVWPISSGSVVLALGPLSGLILVTIFILNVLPFHAYHVLNDNFLLLFGLPHALIQFVNIFDPEDSRLEEIAATGGDQEVVVGCKLK